LRDVDDEEHLRVRAHALRRGIRVRRLRRGQREQQHDGDERGERRDVNTAARRLQHERAAHDSDAALGEDERCDRNDHSDRDQRRARSEEHEAGEDQ
jgi:hypothetical protein